MIRLPRRSGLAPAFLAAAGLAALACGKQPAAPTASPVVRARVLEAEAITGPRSLEIAGVVEAARSAAVSSRAMASVVAVHADLGDPVAAGAPLVSIDPATARGQVAQAEGALAQARAAHALAQRNLDRFRALRSTDSASPLELDMAESQQAQAAGAVAQAEGALAAARSVAAETRVVAPFAGRVVARHVDIGDLVAPGRPLVTVESAAGRRLRVEIPEGVAAAAALAIGQSIPVRLDARPETTIDGTLVELSPGPDPRTHAYTARIELPEGPGGAPAIAAGAAGKARLETARTGAAAGVAVPASAVLSSGGLDLVVVVTADGRAISRAVTLGQALDDGRREVLSGLAAGERIADGLRQAPPAGTRIESAAEGAP